jgi:hypothetical protein
MWNPEWLFAIPLVVGFFYTLHRAIAYEEEMSGLIRPAEFTLVEKDGLLYVQPNVEQEERQG